MVLSIPHSCPPINPTCLSKKKELSCCFGGGGGGHDGLLLFLIDAGEYPKEPHQATIKAVGTRDCSLPFEHVSDSISKVTCLQRTRNERELKLLMEE